MKLSIDYERIRLLKRKIRTFVWKTVNQWRYHYPGPKKAAASEVIPGESVKVLWKGTSPEWKMLASKDWQHFQREEAINFTPPFVLKLQDGRVFGKRGDVITREGVVLTDVAPEIPRRKNQHFLVSRGKMPKPRKIDGSVIVVSCGPHHNYFHFTFDAIGRLRFFQEACLTADYYYIPQDKPFQQEMASIFGIDHDKIICPEKDTHIVARELIVSSLPGNHTHDSLVNLKDASTCRFLRNMVLPRINTCSSHYAPLIYIQRKGKRSIENEADLLEVLDKLGDWQIVRLEEHTVLEQAAIFHHAKVILALHGAGLTNLIYCKPDAKIVEILNPNLFEPLYFFIASLMKLHYSSVMAKDTQTFFRKEKDVRGMVTVDTQKLHDCLASLLTQNATLY